MPDRDQLSPRAQEMFSLIEQYLKSELSQRAYCAQQGLPLPTFHYWLKKYRRYNQHANAASESSPSFMPLHVQPSPVNHQPFCEIEFPNHVVVRFCDQVNSQFLLQLIGAR